MYAAVPATDRISHAAAAFVGAGLRGFARLITGVRGRSVGQQAATGPVIYFANHTSHGDFVLIWTVLRPPLRRVTRPVAGADYWTNGRLRHWIAANVFDAILIERGKLDRTSDPTAPVLAALDAGQSVIIFPEGTRNQGDQPLLPFKSGLYRLAEARPHIPLIPVWIENISRVMPKGEFLPIPLLCSVTFGPTLSVEAGELRPAFLARAAAAVRRLSPDPRDA
jgi:1-acyl-sn-glycerol-3-phosphate acyltransferase